MDVAIIGFSGRFPQAKNVGEFYINLSEGVDSVRDFSHDRLAATGIASKDYKPFAYLDEIDKFDFDFFNILLGEAENIDPHQRLLMEVAYETFEHAGVSLENLRHSRTSVFLADTDQRYYQLLTANHPTVLLGNLNAAAAGRISRFFNLTGNALMVDTACSSGLVALHLACNDLILGNSVMSLVGGAHIIIEPIERVNDDETGIDSPDGKARAFDANANGTGNGEAVVCVLLKLLSRAIEDGDNILGVIKSVAINQDSYRSSNLSSPSSEAQTEVIIESWRKAGINPEDISYIEAHGTGTRLGDPIEIEAISNAFRKFTQKKQFCAISSLKSNIGHTDTVAGLAGLVKILLSFKYNTLFPTLHFKRPNQYVDFFNSPVYVNVISKDWLEPKKIVGLSSFGITGTNVHAVLEQWVPPFITEPAEYDIEHKKHLITLSAKSVESLEKNIISLGVYLNQSSVASLQELSYNLAVHRNHYRYRVAYISDSVNALKESLAEKVEWSDSGSNLVKNRTWFFFPDVRELSNEIPDVSFDHYLTFHDSYLDQSLPLLGGLEKKIRYQLSLFSFLKTIGIDSNQYVGDGLGKVTIKLVKQEIKPNDSFVLDDGATSYPVAELRRRLKQFATDRLNKESVIVSVGYDPISDGILKELSESQGFHFIHGIKDNVEEVVSSLYKRGYPIDFSALYKNVTVRKIELPSYNFLPTRCWTENTSIAKIENWIYETKWVSAPLVTNNANTTKRVMLVLVKKSLLTTELLELFAERGVTPILISLAPKFIRFSEFSIGLNFKSSDDQSNLLKFISDKGFKIDGIIDLLSLNPFLTKDWSNLDETVYAEILPRFSLLKNLLAKLASSNLSLLYLSISNGLNDGDGISVISHTIIGFYKALQSEYAYIKVSTLDFDESTISNISFVCDSIIQEISFAPYHSFCAYRRGIRHIPCLTRLKIEVSSTHLFDKPFGKYLVTGGAFGIAAEVAKEISSRCRGIIIVWGRTILPPREEWLAALDDERLSNTIKERIIQLLEIENKGSKVNYLAVDLGDSSAIEEGFRFIEEEFGKLDGIVHAAGITGSRVSIDELSIADFRRTLEPKVQGTVALGHYAMKYKTPTLLFSSMNAVIPQAHTIDYTVANCFQDAYASYLKANGIPAMSINWGAWGEVGSSSHLSTDDELNSLPIIPWKIRQGIQVLFHALGCSRSNIQIVNFNASITIDYPFIIFENPETTVLNADHQLLEDGLWNQSSIEAVLRSIWDSVLKKKNLADDDNFFELGGHSLLAGKISNQILHRFGVRIEFKHVYEFPTIKLMAYHIFSQRKGNVSSSADVICSIDKADFYAVSPAQRRLWTAHQVEKNNYNYNLQKALELRGPLDLDSLTRTFQLVFKRHEILRTNFSLRDGILYQFIRPSDTFEVPIRYDDFSTDKSAIDYIKEILSKDLKRIFDLENDPLCTIRIIKVSGNHHILTFSLHHLVTDAWSTDILLREVFYIYQCLLHKKEPSLEPLNIQYKDYAHWVNTLLDEESNRTLKEYWLAYLQGRSEVNRFYDKALHSNPTFIGKKVFIPFTEEISSRVRSLTNEGKTTFFSFVTGCINWLLSFYTDSEDIVVGIPVSGRNHANLDNQIGCYVNLIPLRMLINKNEPFGHFLNRVHEGIQEGFKRQSYPFDQLVEDVNIDRMSNRFPLFDVTLTQNLDMEESETPQINGVTIEEFVVQSHIVSFPMNFDISSNGKGMFIEYGVDFFYDEKVELMAARLLFAIATLSANKVYQWNDFMDALKSEFHPSGEELDLQF